MLNVRSPQKDTAIIGFDSAWADKVPGAICSVAYDRHGKATFKPPQLASFAQALEFIEEVRQGYSFCLVALDQPTIVSNETRSRPVERVAGSVVGYVGGGVQSSNRCHPHKIGLFGDDAPIWSFKQRLGAKEDPIASRSSQSGLFLIEVFPALALPGLHAPFAQKKGAPKYNPGNKKKFKFDDWESVTNVIANSASQLGVAELSTWASEFYKNQSPKKADQDCLDAAVCAVVGLIWRACDGNDSAMIGDTKAGYMVTPVSQATQLKLKNAAASKGVRFDQACS